jgi:hypothetical protein
MLEDVRPKPELEELVRWNESTAEEEGVKDADAAADGRGVHSSSCDLSS